MTVLLLDASVWLAAIDDRDRFHPSARELVSQDAVAVAALDLTLLEVANVALRSWGSPADAERVTALVSVACADRLVRCDDVLVAAASDVAARDGLTVYDAAYVAVASSHGWSLVSGDMRDLVDPGHAVAPDDVIFG